MGTDGGRLVGAGTASTTVCTVSCTVLCTLCQVRNEPNARFYWDCLPSCVCACAISPQNHTFGTQPYMFESESGRFPSFQTLHKPCTTIHGLETPGVAVEPSRCRRLSGGVAEKFPEIPGVSELVGRVGNVGVCGLVARAATRDGKAIGKGKQWTKNR
jgi:hypothetical protein